MSTWPDRGIERLRPGTTDTVDHIVVVAGADPLPDHVVDAVPASAIVLAADSGLDVARDAGLSPQGLIGDLDSVSEAGLEWAETHVVISRHSPDKDLTDTELALRFAADMNPDHLTLVGGGDRLDHSFAAIGALGAPPLTSIPVVDAWWSGRHLDVLHGPARRTLHLAPGSRFSLLALHGPCRGVDVVGARWPLDGETIEAASGHGVSNEVTDPEGTVAVSVTGGVLTVFDAPAPTPPLAPPHS